MASSPPNQFPILGIVHDARSCVKCGSYRIPDVRFNTRMAIRGEAKNHEFLDLYCARCRYYFGPTVCADNPMNRPAVPDVGPAETE